ncbi:MAG TPA: hypothetical protein VGT82_01490, partial [Ktedonobacteraceae bacterium]|nr:hypothetical protein [Ktedonobacteraceae bacterium]
DLPRRMTPARLRAELRWAWLLDGGGRWLAGQTVHARPAIARRLREGRRPSFPPGLRDAALLGGTVIDLLAREEGERAVNREGLLKVAEERSQQLLQKTEEQVHQMIRRAEEHSEHLKVDADAYVVETLRNLREHLSSVETEVSRTILSIERGLESLEEPPVEREEDSQGMNKMEDVDHEEESGQMVDDMEDPAPQAVRSVPRRASLAADTMGGPNYQ